MLRTPGLKVVCPATAEDAGLLLGAAVRDPNPVLLFEQKSLYFRIKGAFVHDPSAPLHGARVRRSGTDVTVVSYSAAVHVSAQATERLSADGIECELVDLRVLSPLDFEPSLRPCARLRAVSSSTRTTRGWASAQRSRRGWRANSSSSCGTGGRAVLADSVQPSARTGDAPRRRLRPRDREGRRH